MVVVMVVALWLWWSGDGQGAAGRLLTSPKPVQCCRRGAANPPAHYGSFSSLLTVERSLPAGRLHLWERFGTLSGLSAYFSKCGCPWLCDELHSLQS